MRLTYLFLLLVLHSCQNKQNGETEKTKLETLTLTDTLKVELLNSEIPNTTNLNSENIAIDSAEVPLGSLTILDFVQNGLNRLVKTNDSLFIEFLTSFTTYQNNTNDILYNSAKYEIDNTLAYSQDDVVAPEALEFRDSVKQMGFIVAMTEGSIYLDKDPDFLKQFSPYLSKRMNVFLEEYRDDINNPFMVDNSIIISFKELIRRMIFWENFSKDQPDFELPEYAYNEFEKYVFYLMLGTGNTPIHDWGNPMKVRIEILETYNSVIKQYPNSKASEYLKDFLKYLEQKKFIYDNSFHQYGREKFPNFYGSQN